MTVLANTNETLPFLSSQERLSAYQLIIDGCSHIWSKNKLQQEKAMKALCTLIPLTKNDPYFLAHLTSYAMTKLQSKDLRVFLTYAAALSAADGTPFSPGSEFKKPNLRYIGAAALMRLDPKLAARVLRIASLKYGITDYLNESRHFPTTLRTALNKYLGYREANIDIIKGIKKAGLGKTIQALYRGLHKSPSDEVAALLRWQQKDHKIEFAKSLIDFTGMNDEQIAQKIQQEKLPVLGVLGALPRKMSPIIAVALLEQTSGNQAVILRETFEDAGVLKDKEVMALFEKKIREASTALDRVETLSKTASAEVKSAMEEARAAVRQSQTKDLGKIYVMIDDSGSMQAARQFAIERGSIIAECVHNPEENFKWGMFGSRGQELPLPRKFVKDGFAEVLFGYRDGGGTFMAALYPAARDFGADIDIYITDQENTCGDMGQQLAEYHRVKPEISKPRACVVVDFSGSRSKGDVQQAYEENGIPVAIIHPDSLTESALVLQTVQQAMMGPVAVIDEIMETPLIALPDYYFTL